MHATYDLFNIGGYLPRMAAEAADRVAVVVAGEHRTRTAQHTAQGSGHGHSVIQDEPTSEEQSDQAALPASRRRGTSLNFAGLDVLSNRYAHGLQEVGIACGVRTLVMVRPGAEFIAIMYALFKIGAVPVLIDPGMGLARLLECIRGVEAEALIGIPIAQAVRVLKRRAFRSVKHVVTVGRRWFWGGPTLSELEGRDVRLFESTGFKKSTAQEHRPARVGNPERAAGLTPDSGEGLKIATTRRGDAAAILFTSGSTGPAKGVVYTHGMFDAQVQAIQSHYQIEPGEVDLTGFPPFALFSVAMGMTSVIPMMNPSRPARVDPAKIVEAIQHHQVTNTFGSPAMWRRVAGYCCERDIHLPSLRRVLIAGAPVESRLIQQVRRLLPASADVHTPYGATEAMPVSSIGGEERESVEGKGPSPCRRAGARAVVHASKDGGVHSFLPNAESDSSNCRELKSADPCFGICVGRPLARMAVRIIRITDEVISDGAEEHCLGEGEVGEIAVAGPVVTHEYFCLPAATAASKIMADQASWGRSKGLQPTSGVSKGGVVTHVRMDGEARIWHRMGDCGYLDGDGRIWFCGRKAHRVVTESGTLFSVPCEQVFNEHPDVYRSALVGIGPRGHQTPVMVIEPKSRCFPRGRRAAALRGQLMELGVASPITREITHVLFHGAFPVDVRHNTKIHREALAEWAARRLLAKIGST